MQELIDMKSYPIMTTVNLLLKDKTTKQNIIWGTESYESNGAGYSKKDQIVKELLLSSDYKNVIQPRICKALEQQQDRTHKKGEVFTPAWLCCKMNNYCDEVWFGKPDVFNTMSGTQWDVVEGKISFKNDRAWKKYVDSRRLEITCGEAPYIVSRYDTATGEMIVPPPRRIGILDRKLRIVNENTNNEADWLKWATRAFQSVYGYEFQGDSLLIARINLLMTFTDYLSFRWKRDATKKELRKIANIISWNFWQMDGLTGTLPYGNLTEGYKQGSLFDTDDLGFDETMLTQSASCKINDWRRKSSLLYTSLKGA